MKKIKSAIRRNMSRSSPLDKAVYKAISGGKRGKKKKQQKMRGNRAQSGLSLPMEMCSVNLLKAAGRDPFGMIDEVCIPYGNGRPSQKISSLIRGTGSIGVNGIGFVAVTPTFLNDSPVVFWTQSAYDETSINLTAPGVSNANNPSGYSYAYFDTTGTRNQGRICTVGLRIKYIGTELNMSGQVFGLYTPDRVDMEKFNTAIMGTFRETDVRNFGRQWVTLGSVAQEDKEWDYTSADGITDPLQTYLWSSGSISSFGYGVGSPVMAFMVTGVPASANGQSFAFELIVRSEVIGQSVQGLTTKNAVDIDGLGKVVSVVNKVPAKIATGIARGSALMAAVSEVAAEASTVVDVFSHLAM